jgi:hypothetical protein
MRNWNPKAHNPMMWTDSKGKKHPSTARGLIQWVDETANDLGYHSSLELVTKNPTEGQQLAEVVRTLKKYKPFAGETEFYLSVFAPAYRKKAWQELSPKAKEMNPKIVHYSDYVSHVVRKREQMEKGKKGEALPLSPVVPLVLFAALLFVSRGS